MFGTTVQYQSKGRSLYVDVSGYAHDEFFQQECLVRVTVCACYTVRFQIIAPMQSWLSTGRVPRLQHLYRKCMRECLGRATCYLTKIVGFVEFVENIDDVVEVQ
jgi:hypothetical protein